MRAQASSAPEPRRRDLRRDRISTLAIMAVTAALIFAAAYLTSRPAAAADGVTPVTVTGTATGAAPTLGQPAPDFSATTVDGTPVKLSDYVGRPVWLTFGASWCQPCRAENPDIEAAYQKHQPQGLVVLQVYMTEDTATVRDYATRVGLTYPKVADPDTRLAAEYRILGIPSHFFIDKAGVLRGMRVGTLDPTSIEAAVAEIGG